MPPPSPKPTGDAAKSTEKTAGAFKTALTASQKLAGGIKSLGAASKTLATGDLPSATSAMHTLGAAAGGMATAGAEKLSSALSALGPEGAAAGAAIQAAAGIFAATIGTLADLAGIAIDVTQKIDLMRDRFAALAGSAAGGKAVQASIANLTASLPFASSQVSAWAQSLLAAGLQGKALEESIKGIAAASALMGESGGAAAEKMFKQLAEGGAAAQKMIKALQTGGPKSARLLAEMGLHTADLAAALGVSEAQFKSMHLSAEQLNSAIAKALQKKGKGPLEDMALTLPAILQKAREGFLSLFAKLGPAVKPFMKAVKELFGNFNKGTPLMKVLGKIVTEVFGTLFRWATLAVKAMSGLFKGGGAAKALGKAWEGIKSAVRAVATALSPVIGLFKAVFTNALVLNGLKTIFKLIGGAILVVVVAVGLVVGAFATMAGAVFAVASAVWGVIGSVIGLLGDFASSAVDAASNFISGLVGGIASGAGAVVDAVKNLASSAVGAFKAALGIASPSKVMAKMGGFAGAGAAQGLDQSAGKVEDSAASLGEGVKSGAARGMSGAGGKGGAGRSITFASGAITINAGSAHIDEEKLAIALERLLAAQGL